MSQIDVDSSCMSASDQYWLGSNIIHFAVQRTFGNMIVGTAGLKWLTVSLACTPLRLPHFYILLHRFQCFLCGAAPNQAMVSFGHSSPSTFSWFSSQPAFLVAKVFVTDVQKKMMIIDIFPLHSTRWHRRRCRHGQRHCIVGTRRGRRKHWSRCHHTSSWRERERILPTRTPSFFFLSSQNKCSVSFLSAISLLEGW